MKTLRQYSIGMLFILAGTACSQSMHFAATPSSESLKAGTGGTCQPGTTTANVPTKFLFIVDMSGSNVDGPYEHPGMATDPQKTFRYGVISNFFQEHQATSWVSWGFLTFNGTEAHALINSGNDQSPIFSNASVMGTALETFLNTTDSGDTPYKAALAMAHNLIAQDMGTNTVSTQYRIAFLTDGYPTDYCTGCTADVETAEIVSDVQSLINLSAQSIQMNTVYYGLPDPVAVSRLQSMAQAGNGQFVDTNVSKNINLDDVIQIPTSCQ